MKDFLKKKDKFSNGIDRTKDNLIEFHRMLVHRAQMLIRRKSRNSGCVWISLSGAIDLNIIIDFIFI